MNQFRAKVEEWLSRPVPERAVTDCFGIPVALATEIGLQRTDNQDRVAALKVVPGRTGRMPIIAVAVADGMGGMRDGAKCASIALSSFFATLVHSSLHRLDELAVDAVHQANNAVFAFAKGKGGTTLSAVLIDSVKRPLVVHVGDSRVYSFDNQKVERWTTDDSLAEVVGGDGRELLQFAGMGDGIKPHVAVLPTTAECVAVTTDGIHFIEQRTLEQVLMHATNLKSAAERLSTLSRWCGGPDNASSALLNVRAAGRELEVKLEPTVQVWDPFSTMTTIWLKAGDDVAAEEVRRKPDPPNVQELPRVRSLRPEPAARLSEPEPRGVRLQTSAKERSSKKQRRGKRSKMTKEETQLEIEIGSSTDSKKTDGNSG